MLDFEKIAQDAYQDEMYKIAGIDIGLRTKSPDDLTINDRLRMSGNAVRDRDYVADMNNISDTAIASNPAASIAGTFAGGGLGLLAGSASKTSLLGRAALGVGGSVIGGSLARSIVGQNAMKKTMVNEDGKLKRSVILKYNHK